MHSSGQFCSTSVCPCCYPSSPVKPEEQGHQRPYAVPDVRPRARSGSDCHSEEAENKHDSEGEKSASENRRPRKAVNRDTPKFRDRPFVFHVTSFHFCLTIFRRSNPLIALWFKRKKDRRREQGGTGER